MNEERMIVNELVLYSNNNFVCLLDNWLKEELKEGQPLAYVYCPFDDFCSEFGDIGIDKGYGGIIRIW